MIKFLVFLLLLYPLSVLSIEPANKNTTNNAIATNPSPNPPITKPTQALKKPLPTIYKQKDVLKSTTSSITHSSWYFRGGLGLTSANLIHFSDNSNSLINIDQLPAMGDVIDGYYSDSVNLAWGAEKSVKSGFLSLHGGVGYNFINTTGLPIAIELVTSPTLPYTFSNTRSSVYSLDKTVKDANSKENINITSDSGVVIGTASQSDKYSMSMIQRNTVSFGIPVELNMYLLKEGIKRTNGFYDLFFSVGIQYYRATLKLDNIQVNLSDSISGTITDKTLGTILGNAKYSGTYNSSYLLENSISKTYHVFSPSIAFGVGFPIGKNITLDFIYRAYFRKSLGVKNKTRYPAGSIVSTTSSSYTSKTDNENWSGQNTNVNSNNMPVVKIVNSDSLSNNVYINGGIEHTISVQFKYYID